MNKVLITGGSGFLGGYIGEEFFHQGWEVCSIDNKIGHLSEKIHNVVMQLPSLDLNDLIKRIEPDVIIHAAGTASVSNSIIEPMNDFNNNAVVTASVLDALRNYCPECKMILISSAAVYGNPTKIPIGENAPLHPISPYGFNKIITEQLLKEYYNIYHLPSCAVRIFSAYGAGLRRQIMWDICKKVTTLHEVSLMGNGTETRDFIHVRDIAKALFLLSKKASFKGEVYNLGSGIQVSIKELAKEMICLMDKDAPLIFSGEVRLGDPLMWQADIRKISSIGFNISIGLKEGLSDYIKWFLCNG